MGQLFLLRSQNDLLELRTLYHNSNGDHSLAVNTLSNFLDWLVKEPDIDNLYIYSYNNNWREHGLFVIVDLYQVFVNSLLPNDPSLSAALQLLDWSNGLKLASIPESQYEIVRNTLNTLGIVFGSPTLRIYQLAREKALVWQALECPAGFELRPLSTADAEEVDSLWSSRQQGSALFLRRLIAYNLSTGLYRVDTNELVAWCTMCQCGFLGSLHVKAAYRRRNFATLVVNAFARQVAKTGSDVRVLIYEKNDVSMQLFERLNFTFTNEIHHITTYAPGTTEIIWPSIK